MERSRVARLRQMTVAGSGSKTKEYKNAVKVPVFPDSLKVSPHFFLRHSGFRPVSLIKNVLTKIVTDFKLYRLDCIL